MDTALVTGANHGIGLQIARQLVGLGYRVYGLAADFSGCNWQHHDFQQIRCDLSRTEHLQQAWEHIAKHNPQVSVVVHAYQSPVFANGFEAAAAEDIAHCVQGGLLAPLLLTRWALPSLVRFRGHVINVGWNAQGDCVEGTVAAAVEGGLFHWTQSLFDELRDTGVKVCTVYPQRNAGAADPKARLKLDPQSEVDAKFVAQAVVQLLQSKENNLVTQVVVRPQGTREEPRIAPSVEPLLAGPKDIVLPDPDKRPPPPAPIPTPEPRRPDDAWEFDDEDEEEDEWEEDDELDALLESSRRILREQNDAARRQLQRTREKGSAREGRGNQRKERSRPRREEQDAPRDATEPARERSAPSARDIEPVSAIEAESQSRHSADDSRQNADSAEATGADEGKRRRRRRRGGRGRNRNQGAENTGSQHNNERTENPAPQNHQRSENATQQPNQRSERVAHQNNQHSESQAPQNSQRHTDGRGGRRDDRSNRPNRADGQQRAAGQNGDRAANVAHSEARPAAAKAVGQADQPKASDTAKPERKPAVEPDAGAAGAKVAKKKAAVKKVAVKKATGQPDAAAPNSAAKTTATEAMVAKTAVTKKTTPKAVGTKETAARNPVKKETATATPVAKKAAVKKTATKKAAVRSAPARKTAAKGE